MQTDTTNLGKNAGVPEPVRTYRLSDDIYEAAQRVEMRRAFERGETKANLGRHIQLALAAFVADADAFEAACRKIIGEEAS